MAELAFRIATARDAVAIAALVNACYRGEESRSGWTSEADLLDGARTDVAEIEALVADADSVILLCERRGALAGSVHLKREPAACYLGMLVVDATLQRGGLGQQLLRAAERFASATWTATRMTMTVISERRELIAWYERRGYRRTGERKPFVADRRHGTPLVAGLAFDVLDKDLAQSDATRPVAGPRPALPR